MRARGDHAKMWGSGFRPAVLVAACAWLLAGLLAEPLRAAPGHGKSSASQAPAADLIRSVQSGPWSAAATWQGGQLPGQGSRVQIREGHEVVYDRNSDVPIRMIHVAGVLRFADDQDTRLDVGLIKIQAGEDASEEGFDCDAHGVEEQAAGSQPALLVGTADRPIGPQQTALIRLLYFEGMARESCPAIVSCGGRMDFHGAVMNRTWVKLGATAAAGDAIVTLAEPVTGWRVGDRVLVTATQRDRAMGTRRPGVADRDVFTEERTVTALEGTRLTLDEPLEHEHLGAGRYRAEVANLSRNVVVESADPAGVRGHTMYHMGSAGSISYAEFRHLGKEGVLGRYALHYHLVGNSMRGSYVLGASIWDSHNRWLTIHGTNYLVVRDCVGYRSVGHGFFLEDGTEVYNLLDRNLAVQAFRGRPLPDQELPFDRNDGAGFWWANSLNSFVRNVACENDRYGYRYEATQTSRFDLNLPVQQPDGSLQPVDIRTLPFIRFDDNEAHSNGFYGVNLGEGVRGIGPDTSHPFVVRNLSIWDVHYAFRPQVPSLLVENMHIHQAVYGVYHPNYDHHVYRDLVISQTSAEPFNRGHDDVSEQFGPLAVDGLTFLGVRYGGIPLIQITEDNPTGRAVAHFRNVQVSDRQDDGRRALVNRGGGPRPEPKTSEGVSIYLHDWYGPGRHAKVVSTRAPEFLNDGHQYREEPPLTGDESRVAEVRDVAFPEVLSPIDDLPPATIITSARRAGGEWVVEGVTHDNGDIREVTVNGRAAEIRSRRAGLVDWHITLATADQGILVAEAVDQAGNTEQTPHRLTLP